MQHPFQRVLAVVLVAGAVARCDCGSPVNAQNSTLPDQCELQAPQLSAQKTDILFIIDNSDSMSEEQAGIAVELPAFIGALQQGAGLAQDFQVGVVTTSVYLKAFVNSQNIYLEYPSQSGKLQAVPGSGERILRADDPDLVTKFAALVHQGITGSGQETAFEAARLAVSSDLTLLPLDQGGNAGFLRPGARLLMVHVGDEDDCSELPPRPPHVTIGNNLAVDDCYEQRAFLTPVSTYFSIFQALDDGYGQPREVLFASIAPVARSDKRAELILDNGVVRNADCPTSSGPGFRLHDLATMYDPQLENLDSICNASYHDTLLRIAGLAVTGQSVDVMNTVDGRLLQAVVTRSDGTREICTVDNQGIRFQARVDAQPARIYFQNQCVRRASDQSVIVKQLCAG
jgi:hypothetical protein